MRFKILPYIFLLMLVLFNGYILGQWSEAEQQMVKWRALAISEDTQLLQQAETLRGDQEFMLRCLETRIRAK